MKIQCDVCEKDEALVFCVADEASLCAACDRRVHHANKLAGKHHRFSLHHPEPNQTPVCDMCQERRALLFCQQDRAILCRECDIPIHTANEHTQKHTRFLLTGLKLSATSTLYSASSSSSAESESSHNIIASNMKSQETKIMSDPKRTPPTAKVTTDQRATVTEPATLEKSDSQLMNFNGSITANSISEYLMETLPGWHVEDFLESCSPSSSDFSKNGESDMLSFWGGDDYLQNNIMSSVFPTEDQRMGLWVPQEPPLQTQSKLQHNQSIQIDFGLPNDQVMREKSNKGFNTNVYSIKNTRKRSDQDNCFAVPQISSTSSTVVGAAKRSRNFW